MSLRTRTSGEPPRVLGGRTRAQAAAAGGAPKPPPEPVGLPGPLREMKAKIAQLEGRVAELERRRSRGS